MAFREDDRFKQLEPDKILWRYMDMAKYVSLISRKQLFFCKASKFDDPFEGRLNKKTVEGIVNWRLSDFRPEERTSDKVEQAQKITDETVDALMQFRDTTAINCWHQNDDENFALWKIYSNWSSGIAVATNLGAIKKAFDVTSDIIFGSPVRYIREESDIINPSNTINLFLSKRSKFSYENEVRFIHDIPPFQQKEIDKQGLDGLYIDVDLKQLIQRVFIAPQAGSWLKEAVASLNDKYGLEAEIIQSSFFISEHY